VSKGSRQNRSVPLVKRLALRIGWLGIVLETGFSYGMKFSTTVFGLWKDLDYLGLVNVRTFASSLTEVKELYEL